MRSAAHFSLPFPPPSCFILRQRNSLQKNKWVVKVTGSQSLGILFGFILVEEKQETGHRRGVCSELFLSEEDT